MWPVVTILKCSIENIFILTGKSAGMCWSKTVCPASSEGHSGFYLKAHKTYYMISDELVPLLELQVCHVEIN